jgi:hypothetical protein
MGKQVVENKNKKTVELVIIYVLGTITIWLNPKYNNAFNQYLEGFVSALLFFYCLGVIVLFGILKNLFVFYIRQSWKQLCLTVGLLCFLLATSISLWWVADAPKFYFYDLLSFVGLLLIYYGAWNSPSSLVLSSVFIFGHFLNYLFWLGYWAFSLFVAVPVWTFLIFGSHLVYKGFCCSIQNELSDKL